jgi:predicted nucleic acid-binding protein
MKIYLDNCCYNRPFDDQSDIVVRLEAEAKLFIQQKVKENALELVWSFILDYENSKNPFEDRRERISLWRDLSIDDCILSEFIKNKAKELEDTLGLKQMDAAHIACALEKKADYFITTDRKILKKQIEDISIVNPTIFVQEIFI